MFYGVINETYNKTDYLEMELENSLLFFKSLDIVQESGIQIVQEGAWETFKTKIKELWDKFTKWVKGIWEKIKAIFTKNKNTIEKIKEENKKIKSSEDKVNESFSYIKEESEDSKLKDLKWYGRRKGSADFDDYILSLYEFGNNCLNIDTLKDDESFNKFSNDIEACKNKLKNYDINSLFEEKTYKFKDDDMLESGELTLSIMENLGDEIVKDSEDLNRFMDAAERLVKVSEEKKSKFEKELFNIIKNKSDSEGNFIIGFFDDSTGETSTISVNPSSSLCLSIFEVLIFIPIKYLEFVSSIFSLNSSYVYLGSTALATAPILFNA